ncbi:MAG TPA: NAD(P)-dependent alcohol dehydrogenase [Acidobacteriaceae bacterium]|nr:NAD(P)-dependent alcohol dehydrogenase [Acidobacteriaceae bacterium]
MSDIQGFATHAAGAQLVAFRYNPGELGPFDLEVRISHCGVCHSDLHLIDNDWGISRFPFIPGHEIVGTVTGLGSAVRGHTLGQRVGIGWQADSCGICEWCRSAQEHLCPRAQPTCVARHGGFADAVRVNSRFAVPLPDALDSLSAAPLLCAGLTVYAPLRNLLVRPSSRVGIVGIGGLGHLGIQFARAFGAEVTALSTSREKEPDALSFGAHAFVNTRDTTAVRKLAGSLDLILSTASADLDFPGLLAALRPKGNLVLLGAPAKPMHLVGSTLITTERALTGSTSGSPSDLSEMLDVAARHNIHAATEPFPMKDANTALTRLRKNQVRYRAVLTN